jgi:uncharacterized protein with von Willebrand factor type A (vWA) domain
MENNFSRFEHFGAIADAETRRKLAESIYHLLQNKSADGIGMPDEDTANFSTAVNQILSNPVMREMCSKDPGLAEKITQELLDFINKTRKHINKSDNPFEAEQQVKNDFGQAGQDDFSTKWEIAKSFIDATYDRSEFDTRFYEKEFDKKRSDLSENKINAAGFESIKEHLNDKWDALLFSKQAKWELNLIDEQRKRFCENLYKQIDELKKLQEILEPFTDELGRLWDMSRGNWQSVDLDILKRYAGLLQKDESLKALADMLGKMRQAEKEFEEVSFSDIQFIPEWKADYASKSDLIGIRESDDLSSLLPSETALLADETMQSLFFKKFAEKKLQTFEYQAKMLSFRDEELKDKKLKEKEENKGPFIICVDTSGSMHGTPEKVAKTLCFAILKSAIRDNRKCYLISFSTAIETINLTDIKNSLDKIIAFLSMSFYGGTDAAPAMQEALKMLDTADYKKADVIIVSDFIMPSFDSETQMLLKSAKANDTKFHSLVIGDSQNPAAIREFDNNWYYDLNNPSNILTLVKNINLL